MRAFLSALACLVLAAAAPACAPSGAPEPALWRIADADSEIWLFGTVHVLHPDMEWRGPRVNAAFAAAEELMTEVDTRPQTVARIQQITLERGAQPPGQTLSGQLSEDDRDRFSRAITALGLDPAMMNAMRPWYAALTLSYVRAARRGHVADAGVEHVLTEEARARGLRLSALETPEEHIEAIAGLSEADQMQLFTTTLREVEIDDASIEAMDRAWARGDVETLARMLDADWTEAGAGVHEALIIRRNRAWADAIAARLEGSGRIFVAVGAAHLVGEGNVIELLRARGIEVDGP